MRPAGAPSTPSNRRPGASATGGRLALVLAALALGACQASPLPPPAPIVCEVAGSPDACFRCQAQRCGSALDRCNGTGFHEGRRVPDVQTQRCSWNEATGKYDRSCIWNDGGGAEADTGRVAGPCATFATCFQSCGCGSGCVASCSTSDYDARPPYTYYFANDPRIEGTCPDCVQRFITPCVRQQCAAECSGEQDAGPRSWDGP
jgi:hypothetical protein